MEIVDFSKVKKEEWDGVVFGSDDSWMFHLYDWLSLVTEKVWGFEPLSFLVKDNGMPVAIFPLFLRQWRLPFLNFRVMSYGFGPNGLAIIRGLDEKKKICVQNFAYEYFLHLADKLKPDKIDIQVTPLSDANLLLLNGSNSLAKFTGLDDKSTSSYVADLEKSEEELWKNIKTGCKYWIKKAVKSNVIIKEANSFDDLKLYYRLHVKTYQRTGVRPHPFAYFETIFKKGWTHFFFAYYQDKAVAAINVSAFGQVASYWSGASDYDFHSLGANNLLQWRAMLWAKEKGFKWFDNGEAWLNNKDDEKLKGLSKFKSSFGGELYPFYKGFKICSRQKLFFFNFLVRTKYLFYERKPFIAIRRFFGSFL